MTNLLSYAIRKKADELAARLPHISARREPGAKEAARRLLVELRRQEIELDDDMRAGAR